MSSISFPRKVSGFQASQQPIFRSSCASHASLYSIAQFLDVVRRKTRRMFTDLRPCKLNWIQFRSASWKTIFMHARMVFDELLCLRRGVDFMIIPDKDNIARHQPQNLFQQKDDVLRTQVALKGAYTQTDLAQFWTDKQGAQQIYTLVMVQACPRGWCLSTRRPTPFEWRHQ